MIFRQPPGSGSRARKERILSSKGAESVFTVFLAVDEPRETFAAITSRIFSTPLAEGLGETFKSRLKNILIPGNRLPGSRVHVAGRFLRPEYLRSFHPGAAGSGSGTPAKTASSSAADGLRAVRADRTRGLVRGSQAEDGGQIVAVFTRTVFPFLKGKVLFTFSASP